MGTIQHHAIVVVAGEETIGAIRNLAIEIGLQVTNIIDSGCNNYLSFLVPPDGSKEGWDRSEDCEVRRASFLNELSRTPDAYGYPDWALVGFGEMDATIVTDETWEDDPRYVE